MTDFGQMILDFLKGNPDYMLVHGYVPGTVCMKMKALSAKECIPHGREESGHLPLIGPLKLVDAHELGNALYVLEQNGQLVCDRPEFQKCTLENRYMLPPGPMQAAA